MVGRTSVDDLGFDSAGFVWTATSGLRKLNLKDPLDQRAEPMAINDNGVIVGSYRCGLAYGTAVPGVWENPSASPVTLPSPAGSLSTWVVGINNAGEIVGSVIYPDQSVHPVVWRPQA